MKYSKYFYIISVAREHSISKVARKLGVAQSFISKQIKAIENDLEVQLFDRSTNPIRLTYAGKQYLKYATKINELETQLKKQLIDIANKKNGSLTITLSAYRGAYMLPQILPMFYHKYFNTQIILKETPVEGILNNITQSEADIAITIQDVFPDFIKSIYLAKEEIFLAVPSSYKNLKIADQAKQKYPAVELSKFQDVNFILLPKGTFLNNMAQKVFKETNFMPKNIIESESLAAIHSLVETEVGITFIPSQMLQPPFLSDRVSYFRIKGHPLFRNIVALYNKDRYLSDAGKEFINIIKRYYNSNVIR